MHRVDCFTGFFGLGGSLWGVLLLGIFVTFHLCGLELCSEIRIVCFYPCLLFLRFIARRGWGWVGLE